MSNELITGIQKLKQNELEAKWGTSALNKRISKPFKWFNSTGVQYPTRFYTIIGNSLDMIAFCASWFGYSIADVLCYNIALLNFAFDNHVKKCQNK